MRTYDLIILKVLHTVSQRQPVAPPKQTTTHKPRNMFFWLSWEVALSNTSQQQIWSPASIDPPVIPEQPSGEPPAELVTPPEADPAPLTICSPAPDETQQQSVSCTDPDSSTDSDTNQEPLLTDQPTPRRVLPKRARPKPAWTKDYQMGRGEEEE